MDISAQNIDCSGLLTSNSSLIKNFTINRTNNLTDISILDDYLDHSACFFQDSFEKIPSLRYTTSASEDFRFTGNVLAPNGNIYYVPGNSYQVMEHNTNTNVLTFFGYSNTNKKKWWGGVLASNGKIYCIPYNFDRVLEIDPNNRSSKLIGSNLGTGFKWKGGVLAPNGKIYGIPSASSTILVIDPIAGSTSTSIFTGSVPNGNSGGALAPNGKIYCAPAKNNGGNNILVIDPINKSYSTIGESNIAGRHQGCVLAPNGKIYFAPYFFSSDGVLVVNPDDDTFYKFGSTPSNSDQNCNGCVLAPNGKIYCVPDVRTNILVINPTNDTLEIIITNNISTGYSGGVLASDGNIYCAHLREASGSSAKPTILKIIPSKKSNLKEGPKWMLEPYFNKY